MRWGRWSGDDGRGWFFRMRLGRRERVGEEVREMGREEISCFGGIRMGMVVVREKWCVGERGLV